jgi:hypothetical protein
MALLDRLEAKDRELDTLRSEVQELRQSGTARAIAIAPTGDGPAEASGTFLVSPADGSALVRLEGLPPLAEGRVYQLWYGEREGDDWSAGPAFALSGPDETVVSVAGELLAVARVAISEEPAPGSEAPTGPLLLVGSIPAAKG